MTIQDPSTQTRLHDLVAVLLAACAEHRLPVQDEADLQRALAILLSRSPFAGAFVREHDLGPAGRIDFYFPADRIGLEVKVDGSVSAVLRQLHRYAQSPGIGALCLVTTRARHGAVPQALGSCPVQVVWLGTQGF